MKKRYVAIISISTASLLFGGLVYCGISAFPELLKPEEEEAPKEEQRLLVGIVDTYHHYETKADEKEEQNITLFVGGSSNNNSHRGKGFTITTYSADKVTIIELKDSSSRNARKESIARDEVSFTVVNAPVVEVAPASEKVEHHEAKAAEVKITPYTYQNSIRSKSSRNVTYVNKENKEEALPVEVVENVPSHKEFLECSLLVVGAVEILSFILVKRRKRLMFR